MLKELNAGHIDEILRLESDAGVRQFIMPYSKEKHLATLAFPDIRYLGIERDGRLSGFILLKVEENSSIEFRRIVVADRGKGIGKLAIQALETYCRQTLKARRIWLDVFEDNARAQHIYVSAGYKVTGKTRHGERGLIIMEKELQ